MADSINGIKHPSRALCSWKGSTINELQPMSKLCTTYFELLTRLSLVFPFTLLNYAFGLTRVKLSHYVVAFWVGMMPGTVMYVSLGSSVNVGAGHRQRTTGEWILYGIGLLATVTVTVFMTRL